MIGIVATDAEDTMDGVAKRVSSDRNDGREFSEE